MNLMGQSDEDKLKGEDNRSRDHWNLEKCIVYQLLTHT